MDANLVIGRLRLLHKEKAILDRGAQYAREEMCRCEDEAEQVHQKIRKIHEYLWDLPKSDDPAVIESSLRLLITESPRTPDETLDKILRSASLAPS